MKTPLPLDKALHLAESFIADIGDACDRIEIAGSIRRKKAEVGDIELVIVPKYIAGGTDLFGYPSDIHSMLDDALCSYPKLLNGPKQKKIALAVINIDLFITDPSGWGSTMTIRTGSADFSHWLVTPRQQGGGCPGFLQFKDTRLWCHGDLVDTPEEIDVFHACGLEWIEPEQRIEGRWRR